MHRFRPNGDDGFRIVATILAVLGTLAFLSFVLAGVGIWEKSVRTAASVPIGVPHSSLPLSIK
jgi:hypothetical protein